MAKQISSTAEIRAKIINSVIRCANDFGYAHCNADNIFSDFVYSMFFERQLREARSHKSCGEAVCGVIDGLLAEIEAARLPS